MRHSTSSLFPCLTAISMLWACGDSALVLAREEGTVAAWETVLAEEPTEAQAIEAKANIAGLLLSQAQESRKAEDYRAILQDERLSDQTEVLVRAKMALEILDYKSAELENTVEAWEDYLDAYSSGDDARKIHAEAALVHAKHKDWFEFSDLKMTRISVQAPDRDDLWPNGWQFETDIRLKEEHKDKSIKELKLNVVFLSDEGHVIDTLGKDTATRRYHRHWAVFPEKRIHEQIPKDQAELLSFYKRNPLVSWDPMTTELTYGPHMVAHFRDYTRAVPPGWNGNFDIRIRHIDDGTKKAKK